jgi:hypothetical protein
VSSSSIRLVTTMCHFRIAGPCSRPQVEPRERFISTLPRASGPWGRTILALLNITNTPIGHYPSCRDPSQIASSPVLLRLRRRRTWELGAGPQRPWPWFAVSHCHGRTSISGVRHFAVWCTSCTVLTCRTFSVPIERESLIVMSATMLAHVGLRGQTYRTEDRASTISSSWFQVTSKCRGLLRYG